jgi:hypothetical protein
MSDGNKEQVKHRGIPPKKKIGVAHNKPFKAHKPFVNLNNLFEYNTNTNITIRGERTMFIRPSNLEQFSKGKSRNLT